MLSLITVNNNNFNYTLIETIYIETLQIQICIQILTILNLKKKS